MTHTQQLSDQITVNFTPPQIQRLLHFVDDLLKQLDGEGDPSAIESLQTIEDSVAEATALATWLRESVELELSVQQRLDLIDAMTQVLSDHELLDYRLLGEIKAKLQSAGPAL